MELELEPVPDALLPGVLQTVNETEIRLRENNKLILEWFRCQPHLPTDLFDQRIINLFLRGCKHQLEKVKCKLDMYYTCRTMYPELFGDRDPCSSDILQSLNSFNIVPLPKPSIDGYRITLHRFTNVDPKYFDPRAVFRTVFMIADIRLVEEPPIIGDIYIFDVGNMTGVHFSKIVHPILKTVLHCAQEAYPQRLKEIHLIRATPLIDRVVSFFKQFLTEKMRNRFQIHTDLETVYNFIPKSHLPIDYGGDLKPLKEFQEFWKTKLESYQDYFKVQEKAKSDGNKRPIESKSPFSCDGAFRQLAFD